MPRFQLCDQRIADFVHIPDNAIGTIPENGSVRIFVYGDDHIRIEDSGHMVDRAGDAKGQVYFRLDDDAGLSYYQLVWQDPSVKDGACTGKLSAQELCQFPISRERIGTLQTISDTDNVFSVSSSSSGKKPITFVRIFSGEKSKCSSRISNARAPVG